MFPTNITKEHLLKAIEEIDRDGVRPNRHSSTYDVVYNGKNYPPKYIISLANKYANGTELDHDSFRGGKGTDAFILLENNGFEIISKGETLSYSNFINQLTLEQVMDWWNNYAPKEKTKEILQNHWKYSLSKNSKSLPFNYVIKQLAAFVEKEVQYISSNDEERYKFCEKFDFEIEEDLVFDNSERKAFVEYYNNYISKKNEFQHFIDYANSFLNNTTVIPYKIRTAISDKYRATVVIGMREVLSYYEKNDKIYIRFMIPESFYQTFKLQFPDFEVYSFGNNDNMKLVKYEVNNWTQFPESLLEICKNTCINYYNELSKSRLTRYNANATTTNGVLKKLIFEKLNVEGWVNEKQTVNLVDEYLKEFALEADAWFSKWSFVQERFEFFKKFKERSNIENADWSVFQSLGDKINAFATNALARSRALGNPNHDISHYRSSFLDLIYGSDPIDLRIDRFIDNIKNFDLSSTTELVGQFFPEKYVFFNSQNQEALKVLNIDIKRERGDLKGTIFLKYNNAIKDVISKYETIVGKRTQTTIPLEVDQFFRYVADINKNQEEHCNYYLIGSKYGKKSDIDIFPQILEKSVVSINFAQQLNLEDYYGKNEKVIIDFLKKNGEDKNSCNALKIFMNLKPGDKIAIKSKGSPRGKEGFLNIIGIAEVTDVDGVVYKHDPENLGHLINVKYLRYNIDMDFDYGGYMGTIYKLNNKDQINSIFNLNTKMNFYNELKNFLEQSETNNQKYSHYLRSYNDLDVKVRFGQGGLSKVPWIALYKYPDTVQNGIYPVYLYYKNKKLLILAYGVSETNDPNRKWDLENGKRISQYFAEMGIGSPDRYGNSFVFKVYDTQNELDETTINSDLEKLLMIYKGTFDNQPVETKKVELFNYLKYSESIKKSGLFLSEKICLRFVASILSKPFVILTGLSGSGKTKLAQTFAMWICEEEEQYCIVPVGADWTNREPLLGFPNVLKENEYVKPENKVLDLIIKANQDPGKPYFLILDEMNLSHVERYFSDFLSVMESNETISLHSGKDNWGDVPAKIGFPKNLFIIGTVNIDETTYMFSPKVLDRANVIEFRVTEDEMKNYLKNNSPLSINAIKGLGAGIAENLVEIAKDDKIKYEKSEEVNSTLFSFFKELKAAGAEFGYRSASEILRFIAIVNKISPDWELSETIDAAIMQKLLPKVHGSRKKLEPVLKKLGDLCMMEGHKFEEIIKNETSVEDKTKVKYPVSLEKVYRMYNNLVNNGFTSYAEA